MESSNPSGSSWTEKRTLLTKRDSSLLLPLIFYTIFIEYDRIWNRLKFCFCKPKSKMKFWILKDLHLCICVGYKSSGWGDKCAELSHWEIFHYLKIEIYFRGEILMQMVYSKTVWSSLSKAISDILPHVLIDEASFAIECLEWRWYCHYYLLLSCESLASSCPAATKKTLRLQLSMSSNYCDSNPISKPFKTL